MNSIRKMRNDKELSMLLTFTKIQWFAWWTNHCNTIANAMHTFLNILVDELIDAEQF